jgi:RNA polymerase sigma factor (TIGR02999 family)
MSSGQTRVDDMLRAGQPDVLHDLMPIVYQELKSMARRHRGANRATLSTTELVHETFLKLSGGKAEWEGRAHFFGAASRAMRQVLVDLARRRDAQKRGGGARMVSLGESTATVEIELDEILTLDAALEELDEIDTRLREIVELRFFAGLPQTQVAELLGVSERTVERDWLKARLVLLEALERG